MYKEWLNSLCGSQLPRLHVREKRNREKVIKSKQCCVIMPYIINQVISIKWSLSYLTTWLVLLFCCNFCQWQMSEGIKFSVQLGRKIFALFLKGNYWHNKQRWPGCRLGTEAPYLELQENIKLIRTQRMPEEWVIQKLVHITRDPSFQWVRDISSKNESVVSYDTKVVMTRSFCWRNVTPTRVFETSYQDGSGTIT